MTLISQVRDDLETLRLQIGQNTTDKHKAQLGQYMTPRNIGRFMASMFERRNGRCRLIDAGAGIGSLTAAFLDQWQESFASVAVTAYECDPAMQEHLAATIGRYRVEANIVNADFIDRAVLQLKGFFPKGYTHAIINPPYKKINTESRHRRTLRKVGIETVNLYSAFTALVVLLMDNGGEVVAIIPRSFCNGPYYQPFRELLFEHAAINHVHLFGSREKAFKDDNVLQENVIIHLVKGARQGDVVVSLSSDPDFHDYEERSYPFDQIIQGGEKFIYLPTKENVKIHPRFDCTLNDLGIEVSTGPVVDFRLREFIHSKPVEGSVPLLYATHFAGQIIQWPKAGKKPNAIMNVGDAQKWLYPNNGFYTVTRRFSSKEEKRRITASVCDPAAFDGAAALGFENHLNVFHTKRTGLTEEIARGLAVYLNSGMVDEHFRSFNGHTQVNATDLRILKYPDRETLSVLGAWAKDKGFLTQEDIDVKVSEL